MLRICFLILLVSSCGDDLKNKIFTEPSQNFDLAVGSWCESGSNNVFPDQVNLILDSNVCPSENSGLSCSVHEFVKSTWYFSLGSFLGDTQNRKKIDSICEEHDLCYRSYAKSKSECDRGFKSSLIDHCRRRFKTAAEYNFRLTCEAVALSSYEQVRLSKSIFEYRQKQAFARLAKCALESRQMPYNPFDESTPRIVTIQKMLTDTASSKVLEDYLENDSYQGAAWRETLALNLLTCMEPGE